MRRALKSRRAMTDRSTIATVTFLNPNHLEGAGDFPAGTYSVETMEEQIPGLSFLAYRRVHTTIVAERLYGASFVRQVMANYAAYLSLYPASPPAGETLARGLPGPSPG